MHSEYREVEELQREDHWESDEPRCVSKKREYDGPDWIRLFQFWKRPDGLDTGEKLLFPFFGYWGDSHDRKAAWFLSPKFDLFFRPQKALEGGNNGNYNHQVYSLPSMILNPFSVFASLLSIAGENLMDKYDENAFEDDKKANAYKVANGFLWIPRAIMGGLALIVHTVSVIVSAIPTFLYLAIGGGIAKSVQRRRKARHQELDMAQDTHRDHHRGVHGYGHGQQHQYVDDRDLHGENLRYYETGDTTVTGQGGVPYYSDQSYSERVQRGRWVTQENGELIYQEYGQTHGQGGRGGYDPRTTVNFGTDEHVRQEGEMRFAKVNSDEERNEL